MPDEWMFQAPAPGIYRAGRYQLHVTSGTHARPVRRVVPRSGSPRLVTYDGVEFEVVFDGVDDRIIEEPDALRA